MGSPASFSIAREAVDALVAALTDAHAIGVTRVEQTGLPDITAFAAVALPIGGLAAAGEAGPQSGAGLVVLAGHDALRNSVHVVACGAGRQRLALGVGLAGSRYTKPARASEVRGEIVRRAGVEARGAAVRGEVALAPAGWELGGVDRPRLARRG